MIGGPSLFTPTDGERLIYDVLMISLLLGIRFLPLCCRFEFDYDVCKTGKVTDTMITPLLARGREPFLFRFVRFYVKNRGRAPAVTHFSSSGVIIGKGS